MSLKSVASELGKYKLDYRD